MYGLVGGPFPYGFYYSAGLDVLGRKLREIAPTIQVLPTFGFSEWKKIAADIERQSSDTRIVVYGHSMGANLCTFVAASVNKPVDLIAAFDPTVWYPRKRIGRNVRHVIWFRGCSLLSIAGHGDLKVKSNYMGKFDRYDIRRRHETIDDNQDLHRIVIQAVRKL
jgi:alpha-beta hydrolase superfamily lysophospholipase